MKVSTRVWQVGVLGTALAVGMPAVASASLVFDGTIQLSAQGFGSAERDLTVQGQGAGTESGCVAVTTSQSISIGSTSCLRTEANVFQPNGRTNVGGDEPPPLTDDNKFGVPFENSLGIVTAADIGILFNATEPNGDSITVEDLTLKFFLNGNLIGAIDSLSPQLFANSFAGNGVAGFVFRVDSGQQAFVNSLLAMGNIQFALEATLSGSAGGPETFRVVNINPNAPPPDRAVPEPGSMLLLGSGLALFARRLRRRQ